MPTPNKNESRQDFVSRCVSVLKHEDPERPTNECLGQCYGMYDSWKKKQKKEK
ncbi:MAG: hypothetical protein WC455_17415 [Dehalococcoidia bacterium]